MPISAQSIALFTNFGRARARPWIFAAAVVAAAAGIPDRADANVARGAGAYDGVWNVTIVTKSGSCERTANSTLMVNDGRISASGANVSGSVGREGLVRVSINGAYANGQINGNAGSGKWNGASAGIPCSGRWEASRQ